MDENVVQQEEQPNKLNIASKRGHGFEEGSSSGGSKENNTNMENTKPDHAVKKTIDMDAKKLKRVMSNRASAERSRIKKNEYMADLENKVKTYEKKVSSLQPQVEAHKNQQRLLQLENHQLKLQMAYHEKNRVLREVEIEKMKAEVDRLSELHRKQIAEAQSKMQHKGAPMQNRSNPNANPSGFRQFF